MQLNSQQLSDIQDYFRKNPIKKAFLFGSRVRNEAREESDFDILVELDRSKPIGLRFLRMRLDLEQILHHKVDLVTDFSLNRHIRPYILKDLQLIYEQHSQ